MFSAAPFGTEGIGATDGFHTAVLNTAFGDCFVRTITNSISVTTFAAFVTAQAGDIPGSDI